MEFKKASQYLNYRYWILYIWLISLVIYYAHMYFDNGPITKYAQGIVDVINVYCLIKLWIQNAKYPQFQRRIINSISFLSLITVFYYFFSQDMAIIRFDGTYASSLGQLKLSCFAMTSVFPAIYFTEKGLLDQNVLKISFYAFWLGAVLSYLSFRAFLYELTGNEFATNNMGYLFVSIFPMSFFVKRPVRYIYWAICLFFVFLGAKRGALLLGASLVGISLWLSVKKIKVYQKIIFLSLALVALYYFFINFGSLFEHSLNRLNDEQYQNSARDRITHQIFDGMFSGNLIHWFIGYGSLGSVCLAENFAHNDWLEFFADYGLLGLIPYTIVYYSIVNLYLIYRKQNTTESYVIMLVIVCLIYKSVFSMCFFSIEASALMLTMGYTITILQNEKNTIVY